MLPRVIFVEIKELLEDVLTECMNKGEVMSSYDVAGLIDSFVEDYEEFVNISEETVTEFANAQIARLFLRDRIYIHEDATSYIKNVRDCGLRSVTEAMLSGMIKSGEAINRNVNSEFPIDFATGEYLV
jgi:hypothetical protein